MSGHVDLGHLRGALPASRNSARDLANVAETRCTKRRALIAAGVDLDAAATVELGDEAAEEGQSPFALGAGETFERRLFENGYAQLIEVLRHDLGWPESDVSVVDIESRHPWPHSSAEEFPKQRDRVARQRLKASLGHVAAMARGDSDAPTVLVKPRLHVTFGENLLPVEPDLVLRRSDAPLVRVGDAKGYADHDHRTDQGKLRQARRQVAVYHIALTEALDELVADGRLTDRERATALEGTWPCDPEDRTQQPSGGQRGVLVLRRGRMTARARIEDLRSDVAMVRDGIVRAPATLREMLAGLPQGATLDDPEVLAALPITYEPSSCLGGCPFVKRCRAMAHAAADPRLLGPVTHGVVAPVGDMRTAARLLRGELEPASEAQRAWLEQMRAMPPQQPRAAGG